MERDPAGGVMPRVESAARTPINVTVYGSNVSAMAGRVPLLVVTGTTLVTFEAALVPP